MNDNQPDDNEELMYPWDIARIRAAGVIRATNPKYVLEYNKFLNWCENTYFTSIASDGEAVEVEMDSVDGSLITQHNCEEYYLSEDIQTRSCNEDGIQKVYCALQWYYKYIECPNGTLIIKEFPRVKSAIVTQQDYYKYGSIKFIGVDPHKGIKDVMSASDREKILIIFTATDKIQLLLLVLIIGGIMQVYVVLLPGKSAFVTCMSLQVLVLMIIPRTIILFF